MISGCVQIANDVILKYNNLKEHQMFSFRLNHMERISIVLYIWHKNRVVTDRQRDEEAVIKMI